MTTFLATLRADCVCDVRVSGDTEAEARERAESGLWGEQLGGWVPVYPADITVSRIVEEAP